MISGTNEGKCELSFLQFDMHKTNMQRGMLFVFEKGTDYPIFVAKYSKSKEFNDSLHDEYHRYIKIYNSLSPGLKSYLSRPLAFFSGTPNMATIEEGLPGYSMLSLMRKKPSSMKNIECLDNSLDFLIKLQNETKKIYQLDDKFIHHHIDVPVSLFIKRFQIPRDDYRKIIKISQDVISYLRSNSDLSVSHGDFWANNILISGNDLFIVDWTECSDKYLLFWDFFSIICKTEYSNKKIRQESKELSSFYLRKIDIYPKIENEIKLLYYIIRSVWSQYRYGHENIWDCQWKNRFDAELSRYRISLVSGKNCTYRI